MDSSWDWRDTLRRVFVVFLSVSLLVAGVPISAGADKPQAGAVRVAALQDTNRLLIVDCLLPGKIKRLGAKLIYVGARRAVKASADECSMRGGEYVAYDRSNIKTALNVWLPLAAQGDKEAQTYVGEIYEKSLGDALPDYAMAAQWYQKAADQGYARAMINLGFLYEKGFGVKKDIAVAMDFYRKASGLRELMVVDETAVAQSATRDQELATLKRELDANKKQLEKAKQDLERQKRAQESELQTLKKQMQQAQLSGNAEVVQKLDGEVKQRESELDKQRRDVSRLEQSVEGYREQLNKAQGESAALREQLEQTQQQLVTANKELAEHKVKQADNEIKLHAAKGAIDKLKQERPTSNDVNNRIQELETQVKLREQGFGRQAQEIVRLEDDINRYKARLDALDVPKLDLAIERKDSLVAIAPPSIQMIDPPVVVMRNSLKVKVRGALLSRDLVGKVTAPAGLLSFVVNDKAVELDKNDLFKTQIGLQKTTTPVSLVAIDTQGRRTALDFTLVSEDLAARLSQPISAGTRLDFGNYYALVIGNEKYEHLPKLETAAEDAKAMSEVLSRKYGFNVTTLINATRYQILSEMNKLRAKLTEKDNLLIYYAGHGELDRANLRGHWLPVDAEEESDANWISSVAITDIVNAMSAKHVLIVADSCYAGAMTRNSIGQLDPGISDESRILWLKALAKARCRTLLTSGGVQPVIDGGGGKHSVFAKSLLDVLEQNEEPLEAQRLYREVAARVLHSVQQYNIEQKPEYAPLKFAGHESGDFLFIPAN